MVSDEIAAGFGNLIETAYANHPEATEAALGALQSVQEAGAEVLFALDDATGNVVISNWNSLSEENQARLSGMAAIIPVARARAPDLDAPEKPTSNDGDWGEDSGGSSDSGPDSSRLADSADASETPEWDTAQTRVDGEFDTPEREVVSGDAKNTTVEDEIPNEVFDPGLNITPDSTIDEYPSIGADGTFVTDSKAIESVIGPIPEGASEIRITRHQADELESDLGLNPGSLEKSNTLSVISNIGERCPRCPVGDAGNELFLGDGQGLPGGGPELVVESIPSNGGDGVKQIKVIVED
ncbi:hypothetical protein [Microbulbifer zhoushanensis]|uniref:hypothetical protein n=1 Tax=Microbulbifer zhoushanensis TaxID=2904254 RepID=UPI001F1921F8|nr:hypothetical protein [Microbulbifer zhoushanensis]